MQTQTQTEAKPKATEMKSVRNEARVRVYLHTADPIRADAYAPTKLAPLGSVEVLVGAGVLLVADTSIWPAVIEKMIEAGNKALEAPL